jgi:hypothetical protein
MIVACELEGIWEEVGVAILGYSPSICQVDWDYMSFVIHSQVLIVQDRHFASLLGFLGHTHTDTR